MVDQSLTENTEIELQRTIGDIVAENVSEEDYMRVYAASFHEWIRGDVIKMPPVTLKHDNLTDYLRDLFKAYFSLKPIGKIIGAPFVMRIEKPKSRREPDLQVILNDNLGTIKATYMDGAADICIEVVSKATSAMDYGEKFTEYEKGGVGEYWIIDPIREECRFYRLNDKQLYQSHNVDDAGYYQTPKLPQLKLHVPTLWTHELPDIIQVVEAVKAMVTDT